MAYGKFAECDVLRRQSIAFWLLVGLFLGGVFGKSNVTGQTPSAESAAPKIDGMGQSRPRTFQKTPWVTAYYPARNPIMPVSTIPWSLFSEVNHFAAAPGVNAVGIGNGTLETKSLSADEIREFVANAHAAGKRAILTIKDNPQHPGAFREATVPEMIDVWVRNTVTFVDAHHYDGVDVDWESEVHPGQYTDFLFRLRAAFGPAKLISIAVGNWNQLDTVSAQAQAVVDHINVMCYDMDNADSGTWHNSALFQAGDRTQPTCDWRVEPFLRAGVARGKLGIGLPFFGRRWTGAIAPLQVQGSKVSGWINYGELVQDPARWRTDYQAWDSRYRAEYLSIPALNEFISYTGDRAIREICTWAAAEGFGGMMAFDLSNQYDTSERGLAAHPLATALSRAVVGNTSPTNKVRRILYNLDGDSCMTLIGGRRGPGPVQNSDLTRLVAELTQPGSQVDTLLVCVNAQVMYYPTTVGTMRGSLSTPEERAEWPFQEQQRFVNMERFYSSGTDPYALIMTEAKRQGLETLLTFRMNDAHGNDFLRTAFWRDHPEFRLPNGALDFGHEEVRDYIFRLIEEAVQRYDCDGLELDFQRFPTFFKENGPEQMDFRIQRMSTLVERVRRMLDEESARRGHRLLLAARMPSGYDQQPPTYEKARRLGCDPADWANRSWIDFITVSGWLFTAETLGISEWKQNLPGIPIYAGIQPETRPSASTTRCEYCLGPGGYLQFARERWKDGADGIFLFNFFTQRVWGEPHEPPFQVLSRLAGPSGDGPSLELLEFQKIWDSGPHNAFTDLARYQGAWYCVFREGSGHIPGNNGVIRVLHSATGEHWSSVAVVAQNGVDLRDPKLCITPDGRLMLVMGGSIYHGNEGPEQRVWESARTHVAFSNDGLVWTAPQPVSVEGEWLWRVTWHGSFGYGFGYTFNVPAEDVSLSLWRTQDGVNYTKIVAPTLPRACWPDETTVRFLPDHTMVALVRNERGTSPAFLGTSQPPYIDWDWRMPGPIVQGPNFIPFDGERMIYSGRDFRLSPFTGVGMLSRTSAVRELVLPSGGDTGYPGLVCHENQLWMTYYSSHEGKASVYLAKLGVSKRGY